MVWILERPFGIKLTLTETGIRHLKFWRKGFQVEDGGLMRYDDPENARSLFFCLMISVLGFESPHRTM